MKNKRMPAYFGFFFVLIIVATGCNPGKKVLTETISASPVPNPISSTTTPNTISNMLVPVCDDSLLPSSVETSKWSEINDVILKIKLRYPEGWIIQRVDEAGATRRRNIPEYTLMNFLSTSSREASPGIAERQVQITVSIDNSTKKPEESLLDNVSRNAASSVNYETVLGGRVIVESWSGSHLTYYLNRGSNVYSVAISNLDRDAELKNVCGIIAGLETLESEAVPLPDK